MGLTLDLKVKNGGAYGLPASIDRLVSVSVIGWLGPCRPGAVLLRGDGAPPPPRAAFRAPRRSTLMAAAPDGRALLCLCWRIVTAREHMQDRLLHRSDHSDGKGVPLRRSFDRRASGFFFFRTGLRAPIRATVDFDARQRPPGHRVVLPVGLFGSRGRKCVSSQRFFLAFQGDDHFLFRFSDALLLRT